MSSDEEEPELSELWATDASTTPVAVRSNGGAFRPYSSHLHENNNNSSADVDTLDTHFVSEYSSGAWATRPASGTLTPGVPLQTTQDEPRRGAGLRLMRSAEALSGTPPPHISRTSGEDRNLHVTPGHRRPARPVERVGPHQNATNGSSGFPENVHTNSSNANSSGALDEPSLRPLTTPRALNRNSPADFMALRFGLALESGKNGGGPSMSASGGRGGGSLAYSRGQFTDSAAAGTSPASPDSAGLSLHGRSLLPGGLISPDNAADESDEYGDSYGGSGVMSQSSSGGSSSYGRAGSYGGNTAGAGSPTPLIPLPVRNATESSDSHGHSAYGARSAVFSPTPQLLDAGSVAFVPGQGRVPPPNNSDAATTISATLTAPLPVPFPLQHYSPYESEASDHEVPFRGRHLEAEWERDSSTVSLNGYSANPAPRLPLPLPPPPQPPPTTNTTAHRQPRQGFPVPNGPPAYVDVAQLDAETEAHLNQVAYSLALQRFQRQQQQMPQPQPPPGPPMQNNSMVNNEAELAQQHLAQRTALYMEQFMAHQLTQNQQQQEQEHFRPPLCDETRYRGSNSTAYANYESTLPARPPPPYGSTLTHANAGPTAAEQAFVQRPNGNHLMQATPLSRNPRPPPHPPPGAPPGASLPVPRPVPPPGPPSLSSSCPAPLPGGHTRHPVPQPPPRPPLLPPPVVQVLNSTAGAALPMTSAQANVFQPTPPQRLPPHATATPTLRHHGVPPPMPPPLPPPAHSHDSNGYLASTAAMGGAHRGTRRGQGEASTGRGSMATASAGSSKIATVEANPSSGHGSSSESRHSGNDGASKASKSSRFAAERALVESPGTKLAFKEFSRQFRLLEKQGNSESNTTGENSTASSSSSNHSSSDANEGSANSAGSAAARAYAHRCLSNDLLPAKAHWRVYLELAELAKREDQWMNAQKLFCKACETQPFAAQAWLDWAKMEDERGALEQAGKVLRHGLRFCEFSEPLLTRAIRHEERLCATEEAAAAARASRAAAVLSPPPLQLQVSSRDDSAARKSSEAAESAVERSSTNSLEDENSSSSGYASISLGNVEKEASTWLKKLPLQERKRLEKCVEESFWEQARAMHEEEVSNGNENGREDESSSSRSTISQAQSKELSGAAEVALTLAAERVAQSFDLPADGDLAAAVVHSCIFVRKSRAVSSSPLQGEEEGNTSATLPPRTPIPLSSFSPRPVPTEEGAVTQYMLGEVGEGGTSGGLDRARGLLARLKHTTIDKVWRTVLEGALLEARSGQISAARSVFKYLMEHVPWYGPIYHEAMRVEERCERPFAALSIVHRGLQEIPRYGPLWFGLFRVAEQVDMEEWLRSLRLYAGAERRKQRTKRIQVDVGQGEGQGADQRFNNTDGSSISLGADVLERPPLEPPMTRTRQAITEAMAAVSKELIWKVQFEAAAFEERTTTTSRRELVVWRQELGGLHSIAQALAESSQAAYAEATNREVEESDARGSTPTGFETPPGLASAAVLGSSLGAAPNAHVDCRLHDGLAGARAALASAVLACPSNLRWKVWLAGGRLELAGPDNLLLDESDQRQGPSQGQDQESEREESVASLRESAKAGALQRARALFECAHCEVPPKSTAQVVLECARLEEYVGNGALARQLLRRACRDARFEWKLFLEVVLLDMRACQWRQASQAAVSALQLHSGTGRLWASLIQLRARPAAWDAHLASDRNSAYERLERAVVCAAARGDNGGEGSAAAVDAPAGGGNGASATAVKRRKRSEALLWHKWSGAAGLPLSVAAPYAILPQALEGAASAYDEVTSKVENVGNGARAKEEDEGGASSNQTAVAAAAPSGAENAGATTPAHAHPGAVVTSYAPFGPQSWDYTWAQQATLAAALGEVPKSGEVWCEGARCCLDPLGRAFDPHAAQRYLDFATSFTPQYGDSFVEQLRLHILTVHVLPRARALAAAHAAALDQLALAYLSAALSSSSSSPTSTTKTTTQDQPNHQTSRSDNDRNQQGIKNASNDNNGALSDEQPSSPPRSVRSHGGADGPLAHLLLACEEAGLLTSEALLMDLPTLQACLNRPVASTTKKTVYAPASHGDLDPAPNNRFNESSSSSTTTTRSSGGLSLQDLEQTPVEQLERRCANADPNYGTVWFQCRCKTHETARCVLKRAQQWASKELLALAPLYLQAWVRRLLVERALVAMANASERFRAADSALQSEASSGSRSSSHGAQRPSEAHLTHSMDFKSRAAYRLARAALPLADIDHENDEELQSDGRYDGRSNDRAPGATPPRTTGAAPSSTRTRTSGRAWEGACECALRRAAPGNPLVLGMFPKPEDFATALVGLNRHGAQIRELGDEPRRKLLFGCDQSAL